jgi:hypothetical protein
LVAGALVLAGGDDISSLLLQPARSTKSGTSIRIFFMCFVLYYFNYLIALSSVTGLKQPSSRDNPGVWGGEKPSLGHRVLLILGGS